MPKQSITKIQFKNPDINKIVRPRPEQEGYSHKVDYKKACSGIKPTIKEEMFDLLGIIFNNFFVVGVSSNQELADLIRSQTGQFLDLGDKAFCQYIQEWKDINLISEE